MDEFWPQTSPVCESVPPHDGLHFAYSQVQPPPSYMSHNSAFSMVATTNGSLAAGPAGNGPTVSSISTMVSNGQLNSSTCSAPITSSANSSMNNGDDPMNASGAGGNEITVTPASQPSYSESICSDGNMDGNLDGNLDGNESMDSNRQIDCEVLIDESPDNQTVNLQPETHRQHQLMQRKTNYKVNIAKYHQVTKRELATLIAKKDPGIHYTEVKSRKSELVNNYNRINYGDKETEFVQCLNCKDLLCYSSYDGTTSVTRHLACCPKRNIMEAAAQQSATQNQIVLRKRVAVSPKETYQAGTPNHVIKTQSPASTGAKPQSQIIYLKQVPPAQPNIVTTNIKPFHFNYSKPTPAAQTKQNQQAKILIRQVYPNSTCKNNTQLVKCNENVRKALSRTATKTIYSSLLPFNFFEDKGMKALAQKLVSIGAQFGNVDLEQGVLPNGEETKRSLAEFVEKIQKNLKAELDSLDSITLLIDDYRCKLSQDKFSLLAVQYTKNGCLKNRALALKLTNPTAITNSETIFDSIDKLISDTGTGEQKSARSANQPKQFKDYLDIYDLNDTEIVTSVNRREHFNEEDFNKLIWLDCSVNQLNQILESMVTSLDYEPTVREIHHFHQKCPALLDYFRRSGDLPAVTTPNARYESQKIGHERFFEVLELLKQHEAKTASDEQLMTILTQVDLGLMNRVRAVLNSFYDAKKFISSENTATINLILPCYKKLVLVLNADDEADYRVKSFKTLLSSLLDKYFVVTDKHKIATFLTPRFRSLRNLCTPEETKALIRKIKQEFNEEKTEAGSAAANREEDGNFFNEFCTNVEDIGDEVDNYLKLCLSNADLADDPLKFWQRNKSSFVKLSEYATDILSVPASSTGFAEKLFIRNNLDNLAKRNQIQANLNDYLFINSNLDLLD